MAKGHYSLIKRSHLYSVLDQMRAKQADNLFQVNLVLALVPQ